MNEEEFNKKWETHKIVQEAVEKAHSNPAPETRERLARLEINNQNMMDLLQDNKEEHKEIKESIEDIKSIVLELPEKMFEKADKRYASKPVEKIIYGMVGIFLTGIAVAIWEFIVK